MSYLSLSRDIPRDIAREIAGDIPGDVPGDISDPAPPELMSPDPHARAQ